MQRKEVVVIPADLACRHAQRRHAEARHVERPARQQRHLDLARDAQFLFEPLLLRRRLQQILDAARHLVERAGELTELVLGRDRDAVREISLTHALGPHEQLMDRARDRPRQCQPHDQRDQLDEQKQHGDDDEHQAERVSDRDPLELRRLRRR